MVVGFNHNVSYQGAVYHIQTEDSGPGNATIVSLLYSGGTILASRRTSYADIARVDNLGQVVEGLMKEQHKGLLRSLKNGEFDAAIARFRQKAAEMPTPAPAPAPLPGAVPPAAPAPSPPAATTVAGPTTLDDLILSYLTGEEP